MARDTAPVPPVVTSKEEPINLELLYPSAGDSRFAKFGTITVYQALGTGLSPNGGKQVLLDAFYMSTDQIFSQFDVESIEAAEQKAMEANGTDTTAQYFENMLAILLDREIDMQHLAVELIGDFAVHNYGFRYVARSAVKLLA